MARQVRESRPPDSNTTAFSFFLNNPIAFLIYICAWPFNFNLHLFASLLSLLLHLYFCRFIVFLMKNSHDKSLPPLNAIKAFWVAGQLLNFTAAAGDLGVTQGAISKQIKVLEDYVGFKLFSRHPKLSLTPDAQKYWQAIDIGMKQIQSSSEQFTRQMTDNRLAVNVLPCFDDGWLTQKLAQFYQIHRDVVLKLSHGDVDVDFQQHPFHAAIRCGKGPWEGITADKLFDEKIVLVGAPSLFGDDLPSEPPDLARYPLLYLNSRPQLWQLWAESAGFDTFPPVRLVGFESFSQIVAAAEKGMGVALLPRFYAQQALSKQSLVSPFSVNFQSPWAYYLLSPKDKELPDSFPVFRNWLLPLASKESFR